MKDRRLKIGMISMHVVASWGAEIKNKIIEFLPDDAILLREQEDFERASRTFLIYHSSFGDIPEGKKIPRITMAIPLKEREEKSKILYQH